MAAAAVAAAVTPVGGKTVALKPSATLSCSVLSRSSVLPPLSRRHCLLGGRPGLGAGRCGRRQQQQRGLCVRAEAASAGQVAPEGTASDFAVAFWKFLRPHTIRGTLLGTTALTARALKEAAAAKVVLDWALLPRALLGLLALLCGNGYIVGINQIYDVDIDRVNKPFLPVAAGELSPTAAWALCALLAVAGISIVARNFGSLITGLYALGLGLGTIYSVPPFRLKRFPLPAFLIIATVRGLLLNFGVYYATRAALGLPFQWSPAVAFITVFVTVFATVIAITKDLPDVDGDRANNISTFATRLGVKNISILGCSLLLANYIGAAALTVVYPQAFNVALMAGAHSLLGAALLWQLRQLDVRRYTQDALASFYRFIWYLFYSEYAMLPFI